MGSLVRAMQFYHLSRKMSFLLIGVVMAKLGLDLETIGNFEWLMYFAMLFSFFWTESLIKGFLALYEKWDAEDQRKGQFQIYAVFLIIALSLGLVFLLFRQTLFDFFAGGNEVNYFNYFVLYLIVLQPSILTPFIYQLKENSRGIYAFAIWNSTAHLCAILIPLLLGYNLEICVQALVGVAFISHLWYLVAHMRSWILSKSRAIVTSLLAISLPLIGYAVVQSFTGVFDAWLVNWHYKDLSSFAVFRFGARELPFVVPLAVGLSNIALPLLGKNVDQGFEMIRKESLKLMHLLFPLTIFLLFTSSVLFPLVFNEDFIPSASIFNVYLLLICSQLIFPQTIITSLKETGLLFKVAVVEVVFNVVFSFLLIFPFGMEGVALATVGAFFLEKVILVLWLKWKKKISPSEYISWKWYLGYVLLTLLCFIWVMV